ncbi:nucleotide sugar dehydrogenase [Streptomyces radiopugnans]|uniref:nucleotide sugar dehydrogenase n=1 Tax=Streptomyces radiopugnans TaxID=403935 RepID=UPI003F19C5FD
MVTNAYDARSEPESVAVVGLGYVGIPTALSLLAAGHPVIGIDTSPDRNEAIRDGRIDLSSEGKVQIERALRNGRLQLTEQQNSAAAADVVIICVPTPVDQYRVPDLRQLRAACENVVQHARGGQLVVLTSTTYVGCTTELLVEPLERRGFSVGSDVHVAYCPERLDPGRTTLETMSAPRVVGGSTPECSARAAQLLEPVSRAVHVVNSCEAAEMTKLLENTFRAVNIALATEFSDACRHLGVDVMEVIHGAATKPYGFMPFYPSAGVGGHCIPCDPHYLLWQLRAERIALPVAESAMGVIAARPRSIVNTIREELAEAAIPLRDARILVLGVTYKEGVADTRESSALRIIHELARVGANVSYSDPLVPEVSFEGLVLKSHLIEENDTWDLVLLHTWYPEIDASWLREQPLVVDATYSTDLHDLTNRRVP